MSRLLHALLDLTINQVTDLNLLLEGDRTFVHGVIVLHVFLLNGSLYYKLNALKREYVYTFKIKKKVVIHPMIILPSFKHISLESRVRSLTKNQFFTF